MAETWTPEMLATLRELWATDMPSPKIAERLCVLRPGVTYHTVKRRARLLGLRKRNHLTGANGQRESIAARVTVALWTPEEQAILEDLWNRNVKARVIGARLGWTVAMVKNRAKRIGLHMRNTVDVRPARTNNPGERPWSSEDQATLERMWIEPNETVEAIEKALGRSKGSILGRARRSKLPLRTGMQGIAGSRKRRAPAEPKPPKPPRPVVVKPPKPRDLPPPPPKIAEVTSGPKVKYVQKTESRGCCSWPIGEPGRSGFRFCDEPTAGLRVPYCEKHALQAYIKPRKVVIHHDTV